MSVGAPVIVISEWSRLRGCRGIVTQVFPFILVQLEGDSRRLRFDAVVLAPASSPAHHGGAE